MSIGQPGELLIQGPVVFQGYHNNPHATRDAFFEGFYRTGDVGIFVNGLNYIVDRKKELIKYKGLQVAPAELEDTLIGHPKISDAAVIGVPDESAGEVPRAYVVKAVGSDVTEKEILDFVQGNLANHKRLRGTSTGVLLAPLTLGLLADQLCLLSRWCRVHKGGTKESFWQDPTEGASTMGCQRAIHWPSEGNAMKVTFNNVRMLGAVQCLQ